MAPVHHQRAVAKLQGLVHIVGDHEGGDMVFRDGLTGDFQHLFCRGGVQSGGMLVQQKELRRLEGGHHQRQRLALAAGKQTHRLLHPILQAHVQLSQLFPEGGLFRPGHMAEPAAGGRRQREIFLNGHVGCAAAHRILEQTADLAGALIFRQGGDISSVQINAAAVGEKAAADGVEESGFSCAVGADDGDEIPGEQVQAQALQGCLFIDGAGVEGLGYIFNLQHSGWPPFSQPCGGAAWAAAF